MYKLSLTEKAKSGLKNLPKKYQQAVAEALEEMKESPQFGKRLSRDLSGRLSWRVGIYRVVYRINTKDKVITIFTIGHRASVYN